MALETAAADSAAGQPFHVDAQDVQDEWRHNQSGNIGSTSASCHARRQCLHFQTVKALATQRAGNTLE